MKRFREVKSLNSLALDDRVRVVWHDGWRYGKVIQVDPTVVSLDGGGKIEIFKKQSIQKEEEIDDRKSYL